MFSQMTSLIRGCGIPCNVALCGSESYIKWQHLIFQFIYIVQLYKEDCGILRYVGVVGLCFPDLQVELSSANTAQTTGN